jgi:SAM-dependent methyltransferase
MNRRHFLAALAATTSSLGTVGIATPALAQDFPNPAGDDLYKPFSGQSGKDVVWVPTPDEMVRRMLEKAKVSKEDLVFDLGCGDGKIPIAAARLFGATAKGIEYNPEMAALARRNTERAGVTDRVEIITGDIFDPQLQARYMQASVITTYLLPELNIKLRPNLLRMRPGTRVVTHAFHMGEWEPDETFVVDGRDGYSWLVPSNVAGRWTLREEDGIEASIELTQRYQRIGGTITLGGRTQPLLGAFVQGDVVGFTFVGGEGQVRSLRGYVKGDTLEARLRFAPGGVTNVKGQRA